MTLNLIRPAASIFSKSTSLISLKFYPVVLCVFSFFVDKINGHTGTSDVDKSKELSHESLIPFPPDNLSLKNRINKSQNKVITLERYHRL